MSAFKWCRLWCDHSREMTVEDDSDWDSVGSYVYCTDCGCPLVQSYGYWEPKPGREETCDCPDCKRDFWRPRPPTLPLKMPWRHEGERRRAARDWLELHHRELIATWGDLSTANVENHLLLVCRRTPKPLSVEVAADLDRLAEERDAFQAAVLGLEAANKSLSSQLWDARRERASAVSDAAMLKTVRDAYRAEARHWEAKADELAQRLKDVGALSGEIAQERDSLREVAKEAVVASDLLEEALERNAPDDELAPILRRSSAAVAHLRELVGEGKP